MAELLPLGWVVGATLSVVLWLVAAWSFRRLGHDSFLHQLVVLLTIASLVLFDVLIALGTVRLISGLAFRAIFTFALGLQLVAGLAAVIFVRDVRRRPVR